MSRYIDIEPYEKDGWYLQKHYHNSYGEVIKTTPLVSVPTAEPNSCEYWDSESHFCALRRPQAELKHGRWIVISEYPKKAECSYCGYPMEHELVCWWDYCPNCGAKMDLDEVEE